MARQPRQNPRRHIDQLAAEASRAIAASRENVILSDSALNDAATVRRSDVEDAVAFFRLANEGHETARLLDGPAGEIERE